MKNWKNKSDGPMEKQIWWTNGKINLTDEWKNKSDDYSWKINFIHKLSMKPYHLLLPSWANETETVDVYRTTMKLNALTRTSEEV